MQTSSKRQESSPKDLLWSLLGEYSLREFLLDTERVDKIDVGKLSEMVRELAIPVECVDNIEKTLRNFTREALVHFKQGRSELHGRIRIFCQKKMIDEKIKGGWGYFVIERSRDSVTSEGMDSHNFIDLYFYEEGE